MAAMKYVNEVLEKDPQNFEALAFKSLLYLSQHHFSDGLAFAEKARERQSVQCICIWNIGRWQCGNGKL